MSEQDAYEAGLEQGLDEAIARVLSGHATPAWDGAAMRDPTCEDCGGVFPGSEYGVMLTDDLWERVAPRPAAGFIGSGVLCLDCQEARLGRTIWPEDVGVGTRYGHRPSFRAAMLLMDGVLADADIGRWDRP